MRVRGVSRNQEHSERAMSSIQRRAVRHLRELIAALDRRLPQVERVGEATIAREAAALRADAVRRIVELEHEMALGKSPEAESGSSATSLTSADS